MPPKGWKKKKEEAERAALELKLQQEQEGKTKDEKDEKEPKAKDAKEHKSKEGKEGKVKEPKEPKAKDGKKEGKEAKSKDAKATKDPKDAEAPKASTDAAASAPANEEKEKKDKKDKEEKKNKEEKKDKEEKKEKKDKDKKEKSEKAEKKDKKDKKEKKEKKEESDAKRPKTGSQEEPQKDDDMLGPVSDDDEAGDFWTEVSKDNAAGDNATQPEANVVDIGECAPRSPPPPDQAPTQWLEEFLPASEGLEVPPRTPEKEEERQEEKGEAKEEDVKEEAKGGAADVKEEAKGGDSFAPGQLVQAKYGNSFFDAEVIEAKDGSVRVRYAYDKSEADLPLEEVMPKAGADATSADASWGAADEASGGDAGAGAEEPPAPEPEEDWTGALDLDIGWEATAHLREAGNWRVEILEQIAGARVAAEECGTVRYKADDTAGTDKARCLLQTVAAAKAGRDVSESEPVPDGLIATIVDVPVERKADIQRRLLKLMDEQKVIAAFVEPAPKASEAVSEALEPGQMVEAKFGNSFFEAEVVEVGEAVVKVKYNYDGSEADVPRSDVKPKADKEGSGSAPAGFAVGQAVEAKFGNSFFEAEVVEVTSELLKVKYKYDGSEADLPHSSVKPMAGQAGGSSAFAVGQAVEAKFGNSFFEAEVVEAGAETVKVKYKYDSSEADLPVAEVKAKAAAPALETVPLRIFGEDRNRAVAAVEVYKGIFSKDSGLDPATVLAGRASDPPGTAGVSFVPLTNAGRVIGFKGSVKVRIQKATGAKMEVLGPQAPTAQNKVAIVAGTAEERTLCEEVLDMIQGQAPRGGWELSKAVEAFAVRVLVPVRLKGELMGQARKRMNQIEDDHESLGFWATTVVPEEPEPAAADETELTAGQAVEAKFGNSFFEAEVVEVLDEDKIIVKYGYDGSEATLPRDEVRRKLEGEAAQAKLRRERVADLATMVLIGQPDMRKAAQAKVMGTLEMENPGTYLPSGGREAEVPLSAEELQLLEEELKTLRAKQEEESRWEQDNKWEDQKWKEDKWGEKKWEEKKWGDDKQWGGDEKKWGGEDKKWGGDDKWKEDDKKWGGEDKKWWESDRGGGSKRDWGDDAGDNKRPRTEENPAPVATHSWQPQPQQGAFAAALPQFQVQPQDPMLQMQLGQQFAHGQKSPSDPRQRLQQVAVQYGVQPTTIEHWSEYQDLIWENHIPLPRGWIRVWSRSQDREYYVRVVDNFSVFDLQEVFISEQQATHGHVLPPMQG